MQRRVRQRLKKAERVWKVHGGKCGWLRLLGSTELPCVLEAVAAPGGPGTLPLNTCWGGHGILRGAMTIGDKEEGEGSETSHFTGVHGYALGATLTCAHALSHRPGHSEGIRVMMPPLCPPAPSYAQLSTAPRPSPEPGLTPQPLHLLPRPEPRCAGPSRQCPPGMLEGALVNC